MKISNDVLDKLMKNSRIKSLGLKRESILDILRVYEELAFQSLLENGRYEVGNGMNLEVVQLLDRVHVLRGIPYKSSRKYKLKLTMEEDIYKRIESYYDTLKEDIM